ncbi:MAG TPA: replication initiator, partial [Acidimicrobiales bacterium]|nr:replication initiator [Acidimicrobiales bacterium]
KGRPRRCRPRRDHPVCPHGRALWCMSTHGPGDPSVGTPLCPDCYDYPGAVLFNWWAPELWRRFTIALRRELGHRLGIPAGSFGDHLRLSYAKVAEFQRRGVVHFHAIVRLDGAGDDYPAPTIDLPDRLLEEAIPAAAAHVALRVAGDGENVLLRWGAQVDVQAIHGEAAAEGRPVTPETVAAYVSKYAVKGAEDFGAGDKPIDASIARSLGLSGHVVRTIETAERLASSVEDLNRMRRWTHMLGFRGHFSTKSRRYSTTLGRLRAARAEFRRRNDPSLADARPIGDDQDDEDTTLIVGEWKFVGVGHASSGDAVLAAAAAARAREWRELAREAEALA